MMYKHLLKFNINLLYFINTTNVFKTFITFGFCFVTLKKKKWIDSGGVLIVQRLKIEFPITIET